MPTRNDGAVTAAGSDGDDAQSQYGQRSVRAASWYRARLASGYALAISLACVWSVCCVPQGVSREGLKGKGGVHLEKSNVGPVPWDEVYLLRDVSRLGSSPSRRRRRRTPCGQKPHLSFPPGTWPTPFQGLKGRPWIPESVVSSLLSSAERGGGSTSYLIVREPVVLGGMLQRYQSLDKQVPSIVSPLVPVWCGPRLLPRRPSRAVQIINVPPDRPLARLTVYTVRDAHHLGGCPREDGESNERKIGEPHLDNDERERRGSERTESRWVVGA